MNWFSLSFTELTTLQLYALLKLRSDVFVVEQHCIYPDLDNLDTLPDTIHLLGYKKNELIAYARLIAPSPTRETVKIGRVVTSPHHRRNQLGSQLVSKAIQLSQHVWPKDKIKISAQAHLQHFYQRQGFVTLSDEYLEAGIPHIEMILQQ